MADSPARDAALQNLQNVFRERRDEMFRWAESPEIPADNNLGERGVSGLVIARKTSFGGQSVLKIFLIWLLVTRQKYNAYLMQLVISVALTLMSYWAHKLFSFRKAYSK